MKRSIGGIVSLLLLSACYSIQGPPQAINANGVVKFKPYESDAVNADADLRMNFHIAAAAAVAEDADAGANDKFLRSGFALIYANCNDFFWSTGRQQTKANIIRDSVSPIVSILTGVIALANFKTPQRQQDALAVLAIGSSATVAGLDVYAKNFLFGAENIDSVRILTLNALATHRAAALTLRTTSFEGAAIHLIDNQAICTPPHILALAKEAIAKGDVKARVVGVASPEGADRMVLRDLGTLLNDSPSALTGDQAQALYWLFYGGPGTSDLPLIQGVLATLPDRSQPIVVTAGPPKTYAYKAPIPYKDQITALLDRLAPATKARFNAGVATARGGAAPGLAPLKALPTTKPIEPADTLQRVEVSAE